MKRILLILVIINTLLLVTVPVLAETPEQIMKKVYNRDDGDTQTSAIKLSTCLYQIKNKRLSCSEKPRVKMMVTIRKDYGENNEDSKSVTLIKLPAAEKGIGLLQFDYEDPDRDTDQWMYFSAIGKVKRIVSGSKDEPKTGSFFGSEISYEDLEQRHVSDYQYKILKEETYKKQPCWVVESIPKPHQARKSNYSKSITWISQKYYMSLKSILYNRQGRKMKRINSSKFDVINGIHTFRKMTINNLETKRISSMDVVALAYNIDIEDAFLSQRTLVDSAFRERNLNKYSQFLK
jgi:hypothetical protein